MSFVGNHQKFPTIFQFHPPQPNHFLSPRCSSNSRALLRQTLCSWPGRIFKFNILNCIRTHRLLAKSLYANWPKFHRLESAINTSAKGDVILFTVKLSQYRFFNPNLSSLYTYNLIDLSKLLHSIPLILNNARYPSLLLKLLNTLVN